MTITTITEFRIDRTRAVAVDPAPATGISVTSEGVGHSEDISLDAATPSST
jgi:hypothetical protein